ncbi:MAG: hypothetical protein ACM3ZQ_04815 [Bacillota bacterium]
MTMNPQSTPGRPPLTHLISTLVALLISYPLLNRFGSLKVAELPLQMLARPITLLLGSVLLGQLLSYFFTGAYVATIKSSLILMGWTLAIIPVLAHMPILAPWAHLAQPITWLVGVWAVYRVARCWTQESEVLETALQVTALTTAAFMLSRLLPRIWPTGRLTLRLPTGTVVWSVNQAIVFALIMVAALRSASTIRLAENKLLRLVGETLRSSSLFQFTCCAAIFIYSHDLRPILAGRYAARLGMMEWAGTALILALTLERMRSRLRRLPDGVTVDQLARHLQDLSVTSDDELTMVSRLMAAFVERGDRSGIATYLIAEAARLNVSTAKVQQMAARLLEHREPRAPGLTTRLEGQALERRGREQRVALLQATVKEFGETVTMAQHDADRGRNPSPQPLDPREKRD